MSTSLSFKKQQPIGDLYAVGESLNRLRDYGAKHIDGIHTEDGMVYRLDSGETIAKSVDKQGRKT